MNDVVQLDLFGEEDLFDTAPPVLNGMYYERATDKFVSFVRGHRHYEVSAKGCGLDREWQEKTKRERAI
ncbi:hypothetical protein SAMN04487895_104263 [Paenibacillus sophorae]|uniref:Uncharacterized protein n=1 Tax=Paenibacillus sophorae TaxID=1333845 RepID=A0A1H8LC11_9BACL|nr:hypothetical protein [Paenibacillus sophorae]QWU17353.1 hypothetical protein KP014_09475 [Paenibacillus sophorae]SEO02346.1 hypothetical protein SAMN04487895_104263 [Paenibacillus sophorae]